MAPLNDLDASILAIIAQHSVRTGQQLASSKVKELLSRIEDADAKLVAMFFVKGKTPLNRPDLQKMADGLRAWAERNGTVHAHPSLS